MSLRVAHVCSLVLLLTAGCLDPNLDRALDDLVQSSDSAGIRLVDLVEPFSLPLPEWDVGEPELILGGVANEGTERELFRAGSATLLPNGFLVVLNAGTFQVLVFSPAGELLQRLGGQGEGPGEFLAPDWIGPAPDGSFQVVDSRQRRLTRFSPAGTLLDTSPLSTPDVEGYPTGVFPETRGRLADGTLLMSPGFNRIFGGGGEVRRDTLRHFLLPPEGTPILLPPIPGEPRYFATISVGAVQSPLPYGPRPAAGAGGETAVLAATDRFRIQVFDMRGTLTALIRSSLAGIPVEGKQVEAWKAARLAAMSANLRELFGELYEELPVPDRHAAFDGLFVDRMGMVWIGEHLVASDRDRRWLVTDARGQPVARVHLPSSSQILEIGENHLILHHDDEMGIEEIRWVPLHRGT